MRLICWPQSSRQFVQQEDSVCFELDARSSNNACCNEVCEVSESKINVTGCNAILRLSWVCNILLRHICNGALWCMGRGQGRRLARAELYRGGSWGATLNLAIDVTSYGAVGHVPPWSLHVHTNLAIFSFLVYYIYVELYVISAWFRKHAILLTPVTLALHSVIIVWEDRCIHKCGGHGGMEGGNMNICLGRDRPSRLHREWDWHPPGQLPQDNFPPYLTHSPAAFLHNLPRPIGHA